LPFTLGHEIAGTVEAAGPDAGNVEIGRAYAVYPWMGCGSCPRCLAGDEHLCATTHHLGITVDGGYASHVLVPHPRYLVDISGFRRSSPAASCVPASPPSARCARSSPISTATR
jgi:D-arabinose 1-dehydrogenase-like Zn-dependent alcohol dehydrogenase